MTLLKKYSENYPYMKGLINIFAKFSPSENNHIYSIIKLHHFAVNLFVCVVS